jgi:hypothetical protein
MSLATEWVSRIMAVALMMILPGLAGQWLDTRWGVQFLALVGFAIGISVAIWYLLVITKAQNARRELGPTRDTTDRDDDKKRGEKSRD